jgi:WD40 repeat protein
VHGAAVTTVGYDSDSNRVVTGSFDRTAKVWNIDAFKSQYTFQNLLDSPTGIVYIPATQSFWVTIGSNVPIVYDSRDFLNSTDFKYQVDPEHHSDLSIDTKLLRLFSYPQTAANKEAEVFATTDKRQLVIWKFNPHGPYSTLYSHTDWVEVVLPNPKHVGHLISAGADATIRRWEAQSELYPERYQCKEVIYGHKGAVLCACFSEDGSLLCTGSQDSTIRVWNFGDEKDALDSKESVDRLKYVFTEHTDRVSALATAGHILISGSWDLTIRFWDLNTGSHWTTIQHAHDDFITGLSYSPERDEFATCSIDHLCYTWSMDTRKLTGVLRGHENEVTHIAWNKVLRGWVTLGEDLTVRHWSPEGEQIRMLQLPEEAPTALTIDSVFGYAVIGLMDKSVIVMDLEAVEHKCILQTHTGHSDIVKAVVHLAERNQYVTASWDHTVRVFIAHSRERMTGLGHLQLTSSVKRERRDSEDSDIPYHESNPPHIPKTLKNPPPSLPFETTAVRQERKEPDSKLKTELAQKLDELETTLTKMLLDQRRAQQESIIRERDAPKAGGHAAGKAGHGGGKKATADGKSSFARASGPPPAAGKKKPT